jgi:hypothetical protein
MITIIGTNSQGHAYAREWARDELLARLALSTAPHLQRFAAWLQTAQAGESFYLITCVVRS